MILDKLTLAGLISVVVIAATLFGICKLRGCNRPID